MNARRRSAKRRDYPANLYDKDGYFYYRNPLTGKDKGLGRNKGEAFREAKAANLALATLNKTSLTDWVLGKDGKTLAQWCDDYIDIIVLRGKLKPNSLAMMRSEVKAIKEADFAWRILPEIKSDHIKPFLTLCETDRGPRMAQKIRSRLNDVFIEAGSESNPVLATRKAKAPVKRDRLSLEQFLAIRDVAEPWLVNAMNNAILTGQRREDIANQGFKDQKGEFLEVVQGKTGMRIKVHTSIRLNAIGMSIEESIRQCRDAVVSQYMIHHTQTRNKLVAGSKVNIAYISNGFAAARDFAGVVPREGWTPPTFHEIRSLSERLYRKQYGPEFVKKLMGHKSQKMTDHYDDLRGSDWVEVRPIMEKF